MPCKSGCPSGMRRVADFVAVFVVWALAGTAGSERSASAIPAAALVLEMNRPIFKPPRLPAKRMFPVRAIQELLDKFHALEIQDLGVFFLAPVQRHADFPGARKDARI